MQKATHIHPLANLQVPAHSLRDAIRAAADTERVDLLHQVARGVRVSIVTMIGRAKLGHIGSDFSVADILSALFFDVMRIDPANPKWPERDRFILSKGHCSAALYAVLAELGFFSREELQTFMAPLSRLNGHPNRKIPGVEANTGPLGHGLPIAVGCAIAARLSGAEWHTFVVLGDGELQEGSNWEAAMAAGHRQLSGLTAIVDRNGLQQGARTEETNRLEPLGEKWRSFGWEVAEIDGHDFHQLHATLNAPRGDRPRCVIARTHKGKGASFMEDRVEWHHKVPSPEQIVQILADLETA